MSIILIVNPKHTIVPAIKKKINTIPSSSLDSRFVYINSINC